MKMTIVGIEVSEGVSKKNGQAYSIGQLHTLAPLAHARTDGNVAKGMMGTSYQCDANLLRKIQHLSFPVSADVVIGSVMRYGKREEQVEDILPIEVVKKAV